MEAERDLKKRQRGPLRSRCRQVWRRTLTGVKHTDLFRDREREREREKDRGRDREDLY